MTFWGGVLLGFVASILANHYWDLRARYRAYRIAGRLVGTWVAYNIHGRTMDATPIPGAGLTKVSSKPHGGRTIQLFLMFTLRISIRPPVRQGIMTVTSSLTLPYLGSQRGLFVMLIRTKYQSNDL